MWATRDATARSDTGADAVTTNPGTISAALQRAVTAVPGVQNSAAAGSATASHRRHQERLPPRQQEPRSVGADLGGLDEQQQRGN